MWKLGSLVKTSGIHHSTGDIIEIPGLVNVYIYNYWKDPAFLIRVNPLFQWPFSIAM